MGDAIPATNLLATQILTKRISNGGALSMMRRKSERQEEEAAAIGRPSGSGHPGPLLRDATPATNLLATQILTKRISDGGALSLMRRTNRISNGSKTPRDPARFWKAARRFRKAARNLTRFFQIWTID